MSRTEKAKKRLTNVEVFVRIGRIIGVQVTQEQQAIRVLASIVQVASIPLDQAGVIDSPHGGGVGRGDVRCVDFKADWVDWVGGGVDEGGGGEEG